MSKIFPALAITAFLLTGTAMAATNDHDGHYKAATHSKNVAAHNDKIEDARYKSNSKYAHKPAHPHPIVPGARHPLAPGQRKDR